MNTESEGKILKGLPSETIPEWKWRMQELESRVAALEKAFTLVTLANATSRNG